METTPEVAEDMSTISVGLTREELMLALIECPSPADQYVARYEFNTDTGVSCLVVSWCNEITDDKEW